MRNVTLRQMRVFAAVARSRSFTRAARELHLTQPAISQQIKLLETEVGLPLLEHVGRQIHLTAAGDEVRCRSYRVVSPDPAGFLPSPAYRDTLVRGARAAGLPAAYVARLESLADNGYEGGGPS